MSMANLFSEDYQPIAGSDPEQLMTPFVLFTDKVLPPIQEKILELDEKVVFSAAVDRNGFLPTHKISKPQGPDPVWNNANCRNRRMFNDRTGLAAGQNKEKFLLQTYRRDMGGGKFVMMKDLSAPITVQGRHWGGLRIGYSIWRLSPSRNRGQSATGTALPPYSTWFSATSYMSKLRSLPRPIAARTGRLNRSGTRCSVMPPCERSGSSRADRS